MLVPFPVVRVSGSATSRPYAEICAAMLTSLSASLCFFLIINRNSVGSVGSVGSLPASPRRYWVFLNQLQQFCVGSAGHSVGSPPAREKTLRAGVGSKQAFVGSVLVQIHN
ncbi:MULTISPECIES: hypothetical protein [Klebsiella pneumoniae complex]|uniref:hypothetical protein n=1 Tax=Klebsiella pneumoniae complex TaxID=3390273 RepID=UPI001403DF04|nr:MULTISPECIES: hypothetical protein [Klebsiella]HBQ6956251.1 hypothetical protein [Klebsiella pneumoniae]